MVADGVPDTLSSSLRLCDLFLAGADVTGTTSDDASASVILAAFPGGGLYWNVKVCFRSCLLRG